jgi:ElaB/YqjD/DUF883 family membrane-anchored ribosome-binding protein
VTAVDKPEECPHTQERLIGDLRLVIENAEELLKNTDQYTSLHYQSARAKLAMALSAATAELARVEDAQLERMIVATHQASLMHADKTGEARVLRAFH